MPTIFFTGFPGFLGSELLPRVLARSPEDRAVCIVQKKFLEVARQRAAELEERHPGLGQRIELLCGDITEPDLGLAAESQALADEITEIYHLAAVYDLSVRRPVAMKVNVDGTRHVLDLAEKCRQLGRFQYVSTCYVSGRYAGIFGEQDLEKGQKFNNFYEETKYLAEVEVQARMGRGLPATVYRPSIVVGDSRSGATQKFDGPYYVIRWMMRQLGVAVVPVVGDPTTVRVNLVPRDFVIDAMAHLSGMETSLGKVYQLADPEPLTVDELLELVARATRKRVLRLPLPLAAAKTALDWVPGVYRLLQIPSSAVDYFVHPTHYTCHNTLHDLEGSGIVVPPFPSYVERLVEFVRTHPEIGSEAMA
jgi:thioester reductase-like protein